MGRLVYQSQVFRVLRQLGDQRKVHRVELLKGYIVNGPEEVIDLVCNACGSWTRVTAPALFGELAALALREGMNTRRLIVESTGLCAGCRELPNRAAVRSRRDDPASRDH